MRWSCLPFAASVLLLTAAGHAYEEPRLVPVARIALGPAIHVAPASSTQLALDATAGFWWMPTTREVGLILNPELGYEFDGIGLHAFNVACGLGYGLPWVWVAYQPRLVVGGLGGETAIGMRNGLAMHVLFDMGSLEIAHEFVAAGGQAHHDIKLMFGVNPAAFVFMIRRLGQ